MGLWSHWLIASTSQYLTLFHLCFCLDTLFNVYCWFMNIELSSQQHYNTCLKEAYPMQIYFLHKAHHSLCARRTVDNSSALCLLGVGGVCVLNRKILNKKYRNMKNVALKRPWKGHSFTVQELNKKAKHGHFLPQLVGTCSSGNSNFFAHLWVSTSDCESSLSVDFGVRDKF